MQIATKSVGGYAEFRAGQWDPRLFYPGSGKERGEARFCFVPGSSHGSQSTALSLTRMDLRPCRINVYGEGIVLCLCPALLKTVYGMP